MARVLLVDHTASWKTPVLKALGSGVAVDDVGSVGQLTELLANHTYAVAILASGASPEGKETTGLDLETARSIHRVQVCCRLLFLVDRDLDLETSCQAVRLGAAGFVEAGGPDAVEEIHRKVIDLLSHWQRERDQSFPSGAAEVLDQTGIATQSENMLRLLAQARKAANVCDAPIVIEGESGTGKQLLAEAIHRMDPKRSGRPFVSVNCAAITGTLAESALFGHRKGAFTGATEDRKGYFRTADGGTLMLDEISELDPALQPKLLRVLQEGRVLPVGDDREYPIDVRVITASNKPLAEQVVAGRFRLDLYQRLNVIRLRVPALRERLQDIPLLVAHFLEKYAGYYGGRIEAVDPAVYRVLQRAVGEGNVRELENIVRQTLAFKTSGSSLTLADLPEQVLEQAEQPTGGHMPADLASYIAAMLEKGPLDLDQFLTDCEQQVLETAISRFGLKGMRLASHLDLNRRTLYHKLRRHQLIGPS